MTLISALFVFLLATCTCAAFLTLLVALVVRSHHGAPRPSDAFEP